MNTINLNTLADEISLSCPVLVESVSDHTIILKGRNQPYRMYMRFENNLPKLQIDLYDEELRSRIENDLAGILNVYQRHTVEQISINYLHLTY